MSLQFTVGVTRWWAGQDNAVLTELTSSHANRLKTRRLPPPWSRCSSEGRVHTVLGSGLCASGVANDTCLPLNEGKRDDKATAGASALIMTKAFNPNPASMGQNDATSNR